ncbi:MAG: PepSY domain-containing protein [Rhodospirillaceae bacterium]|nr:PepSY domain-containing protein [Rhodospirillaceae bacterium]
MSRWTVALALALAMLAPPQAGRAQSDQQRALDAVEAGRALPLKQILPGLRRDFPGQILDAQLYERDGRWLYRIKLLGADGKVQAFTVDARTGAVMDRR